MIGEPLPGERAPRNDRQLLRPGAVERGAHQATADAAAAERVGDLGVDEDRAARVRSRR